MHLNAAMQHMKWNWIVFQGALWQFGSWAVGNSAGVIVNETEIPGDSP